MATDDGPPSTVSTRTSLCVRVCVCAVRAFTGVLPSRARYLSVAVFSGYTLLKTPNRRSSYCLPLLFGLWVGVSGPEPHRRSCLSFFPFRFVFCALSISLFFFALFLPHSAVPFFYLFTFTFLLLCLLFRDGRPSVLWSQYIYAAVVSLRIPSSGSECEDFGYTCFFLGLSFWLFVCATTTGRTEYHFLSPECPSERAYLYIARLLKGYGSHSAGSLLTAWSSFGFVCCRWKCRFGR